MHTHAGAVPHRFTGLTIPGLLCVLILTATIASCGGGSKKSSPHHASASIGHGALVFDSDRTGQYEIFTMGIDGSNVQQLTTNSSYDSWWPRLSPNRQQILFYRAPAGVHDTDYAQTSLWLMNADGSGQHQLRAVGSDGWVLQGHAEWSPAGDALVMFGGSADHPQIYATAADGSQPRRITNGNGYWLDPSWAPDGSRVTMAGCAATPCTVDDFEIYTQASSGSGSPLRLTTDNARDHDPYYSPDGQTIAWLTQSEYPSMTAPLGVWNIHSANTDGSNPLDLTADRNINSKPDWSETGDLIYFHRFVYGQPRWQIFSMTPNGQNLQSVSGNQAGNNEFPDQ